MYSSFFHSGPKLETTQINIYSLLYRKINCGIGLHNKKEQAINTHNNVDEFQKKSITLSERTQTQKATYYVILFIWDAEKGKTRDRKQISSCQGLGMGMEKWLQWGMRELFKADENIFILIVDSFLQLHVIVKTHQTVYLKWVNLIVCKLFLNIPELYLKS